MKEYSQEYTGARTGTSIYAKEKDLHQDCLLTDSSSEPNYLQAGAFKTGV